jgi:hypothetical protein
MRGIRNMVAGAAIAAFARLVTIGGSAAQL